MARLAKNHEFLHKANILGKIELDTKVQNDWLDILGQVATRERLKNPSKVLPISDDHGFFNHAGNLVMTVVVGQERLEMEIPKQLWAHTTPKNSTELAA